MTERDLRIGILTCSSECAQAEREDTLGTRMVDACESLGWLVVAYHVCQNDPESVAASLIEMAEADEVNVVFTLGGVGLEPSDVVPDMTQRICERDVPGIAEAIRARIMATDSQLMMSRGTAGIRGRTLIINLPGTEKPAFEAFDFVVGHLARAVDAIETPGLVFDEEER